MTASKAPKKAGPVDRHPRDVVAALHKLGWSLRQLAAEAGYSNPNSLAKALHKPYPKAERIIAAALDEAPHTIWPSRYGRDGKPSARRSGPAPMRPASPHRRAAVRAAATQN